MIKLIIPGKPLGKQRPRVTRWGTHTPEKTLNYETLVKELFINQYKDKPLEGPIQMKIIAYFDIPKSTSNKKQRQMQAGLIRPTKKPDMDNITKIIADALNTLAYKDDSQIVELHVIKLYDEQPRVEVIISEVS